MKEQYFTAKQVADILGISKTDLLNKEHEGILPKPKRQPATKFRYYTTDDVSFIRRALGLVPIIKGHRRQLFLNFKGGTGKSTLASSYAYHLAQMGVKVLAIDLDAQGHMTKCLGYDGAKFKYTIYNVLVDRLPISEAIVKTKLRNFDLLPANLSLSPVELSLTALNARELRLQRALEAVKDIYQVVVIDAPPNIGLLNLNALLATDDLIVPVLADFLSYEALKILFETLASIEEDFQFVLDRILIMLNRYNDSMNICKQSRAALRKHYGQYLMKTTVRQCTKFADCSSLGTPITQYAPSSTGAQDIDDMVKEVFSISRRPVDALPTKQSIIVPKDKYAQLLTPKPLLQGEKQ